MKIDPDRIRRLLEGFQKVTDLRQDMTKCRTTLDETPSRESSKKRKQSTGSLKTAKIKSERKKKKQEVNFLITREKILFQTRGK